MLYFTAVIDLFSRKILSWRLSDTMEVGFCIDAVNEAIFKYGVPAIFNDQRLHEALGYQTPSEVYAAGCFPNIKGIEEQIEQEEITA